MNLDKMLIQTVAILLTATGFLLMATVTELTAQRRIEIPELPMIMPGSDMGVIMDGNFSARGTHSSVRMRMENGVKKINAVENGIQTFIQEDPDNGILVKITRQYGPEDMDLLMEEHPDLYMSVKDFPAETENAEAVEVNLKVTKKYQATNLEELQEKHPQAFQAYTRYATGNSERQIFRGRFGSEMLLPEIRIRPEIRGIDPNDVRIHDEPATPPVARPKKDQDT